MTENSNETTQEDALWNEFLLFRNQERSYKYDVVQRLIENWDGDVRHKLLALSLLQRTKSLRKELDESNAELGETRKSLIDLQCEIDEYNDLASTECINGGKCEGDYCNCYICDWEGKIDDITKEYSYDKLEEVVCKVIERIDDLELRLKQQENRFEPCGFDMLSGITHLNTKKICCNCRYTTDNKEIAYERNCNCICHSEII